MPTPRLFIGSSKENLEVARVLKEGLLECAEIKLWNENVFDLNQGFLETLLGQLREYDFAVFIFAGDDLITSNAETMSTPRDNVLFECGLFMGALGRERVFLVCDESAALKIPSDFSGVTLASYNGEGIVSNPAAAVETACTRIRGKIQEGRLPHLVGVWKSVYRMTIEEGWPLCEEYVEICACRGGVSIISKKNEREDDYSAWGKQPENSQIIIGEWVSKEESTYTGGVFVLNVSPDSTYMYGYFTSPDERGGFTYAGWALAKIANADEAKIKERLKKAQTMLSKTTVGFPS
jgi:hypothetical protein